jgi:hypothetical protein
MESFAKVQSGKNRALLATIAATHPESLQELAEHTGRKASNLSRRVRAPAPRRARTSAAGSAVPGDFAGTAVYGTARTFLPAPEPAFSSPPPGHSESKILAFALTRHCPPLPGGFPPKSNVGPGRIRAIMISRMKTASECPQFGFERPRTASKLNWALPKIRGAGILACLHGPRWPTQLHESPTWRTL